MKAASPHIIRFEHQKLKVGQTYNGVEFKEEHLKALQLHYGNGVSYYNLIHRGIQLNEYVGVLQVGSLTIEILPKADKDLNTNDWQKLLIGMLKASGLLKVKAPSSSALRLQSNSILDLYIELFLNETEYLLKRGLIKQYRTTEGNQMVLKGALLFGRHLTKNMVHAERFYTRYKVYDTEHTIHKILYKTLVLLKQIHLKPGLQGRIYQLLLFFPEMPDLKVSEATFHRIVYNRKTDSYKNALDISRLLLLSYHPDLMKGQNHVLALLFDMNQLWEKFVLASLRKKLGTDYKIKGQSSKTFWIPKQGYKSGIRPDIVVEFKDQVWVLDTKWKNIGDTNPGPDDLRQMYVYHEYFNAQKVALIYPGNNILRSGNYAPKSNGDSNLKECCIISLKTETHIEEWQNEIATQIGAWAQNGTEQIA